MDADTLAVLACSACGRRLAEDGDGLRCDGCGRGYPMLGKVPCLLPDPVGFRIEWRGRVEAYAAAIETRLQQIGLERNREPLSRATRGRLLRVTGALDIQRRAVTEVMDPIVAVAEGRSFPPALAGAEPAAALAVLRHYENIFRDWAWGDAERERQRTLLTRLLSEPVHDLAMYGAGAGRLAADLHQHLAPRRTFALDVNPLPLLVADLLVRGGTIELPGPMPFAPPFAPGSLDVVVTPWFIDDVTEDFRATAAAINRALRVGGQWLNIGPLLFKGPPSGQHVIGEVLGIVEDSGFELQSDGSEDLPYFRSPFSGSSRVDTVFWYAARKTAETPPVSPGELEPPWLSNPALAVPLSPQLSLIARSSTFSAGVLSMVDGKRSIAEMAAWLAQAWNADPVLVQDQLRAFFRGALGGA